MKLIRKMRRYIRRLERNSIKKYPTRSKQEQDLIDKFIQKRLLQAHRNGWHYEPFPCTINGGEIISDSQSNQKIQLQLSDYESYARKHHLSIRYVDEDSYGIEREGTRFIQLII